MKIGNAITNPGELKTKIILESVAITQDAGGFETETYTPIATVWSRWRNPFGRSLREGYIAQVEVPAEVRIRYRADVDESIVANKNGIRYDIKKINDIEERHEWLEFYAIRRKVD